MRKKKTQWYLHIPFGPIWPTFEGDSNSPIDYKKTITMRYKNYKKLSFNNNN